MKEQNGIIERNRTGCPIHKRQEKILRVNIGKEVLGYRVITTRGREIIEVSEPIRLFFYSLDGELDLKPITRPMRIARFRVCEWRYAVTKTNKYGQRFGIDVLNVRSLLLILKIHTRQNLIIVA